ncbi:MAG: type IV secretory system conjugative DNA transfer family protein [Leptospiraceae bacterium]|nr:type IV secretory system conjugative DNA transfer family protein [Leptospiraceae bacterium]
MDTGEGHLFTVAPTGAGKGTGCIVPALLRYAGPIIVVDPKGENYAVTARRRRELGQEVILLHPFEIVDTQQRHRFNPLDLADPRSDRFVEDVATLSGLATSGNAQNYHSKDLFWREMGKTLITAVILDIMTMPDSEVATLSAVRQFINSPLEVLRERSKKWQEAEHQELRRLVGMLSNPADETLGGYVAFAMHQLDFIKGKQLEEHLSASDLDLNKVLDGAPLTIYLVLPPDKLESHAGLLRLWIGTLVSVITRRRKIPAKSTLMLIDEAAQLGELRELRQAITLLRGYGVRVWTFWQDMSQLQNLYAHDWETILNNCRIQQYFGATTAIAADAVVEASGYGSRDSVLDLERDEMILNIAGDEAIVARTPNYLYDPPFQSQFDSNPYYLNRTAAEYTPRTRPVYRKTEPPAVRHRARTVRQAMILANRIFHPVPIKNWVVLEGEERLKRLKQAGIVDEQFVRNNAVSVRVCELPFYAGCNWYDIQDARSSPNVHAYYVMCPEDSYFLNGNSAVIHELNEKKKLLLNIGNVRFYLEFFSTNVHGESGRFLILDSADELEWKEPPEESFLDDLRLKIAPPRLKSTINSEKGTTYLIEAELVYENGIFSAGFRVEEDGTVSMEADAVLAGDLPMVQDLERLRFIGEFDEAGKFTALK